MGVFSKHTRRNIGWKFPRKSFFHFLDARLSLVINQPIYCVAMSIRGLLMYEIHLSAFVDIVMFRIHVSKVKMDSNLEALSSIPVFDVSVCDFKSRIC